METTTPMPENHIMRAYRDRQRDLSQLAEHLEVWEDELGGFELRERRPIASFIATAPDGSEKTLTIGNGWENRFGIHKFRSSDFITLPDEDGVELRLDFGGETLVHLAAEDSTIIEKFAANPCHKRFDVPKGIPFQIKAESAARSLFGIPNRDPKLNVAEVYAFYPEIRALRRRLTLMRETAQTVQDKALARSLFEVAEVAISMMRLPTATCEVGPRVASRDWTLDVWERSFEPTDTPAPLTDAALQSVVASTQYIDDELAKLRTSHPKMGKVKVTGHAHIDYAWLWPQPETVRKITRTFSSVNSLLKRHDDFRFLQSSSLFYEHISQEDPDLFEEIKERVAEGSWEITGGMLIECDTNMPSAEAFLRQFMHGQSDFESYFGKRCNTAWLPDTFGFTSAMPQIMRHAGIDKLMTIKISWNETNALDDNIFNWQGNDGSQVFVHMFNAYDNDGYNMLMTPAALDEVWTKHTGKDLTDTVIASYGWGDGGGGPDPDQIESVPLLNLMPSLPTVEHGQIEPHLEQLATELKDAAVPVWSGELYLEYHRATLTTQARTKQLNRLAENALMAAEAASVIDALSGGSSDMPDLHDDWRLMLRNQFHDILPGSSVREVYEQTEPELEGIVERSEAVVMDRMNAVADRSTGERDGLLVANLSGSAKKDFQITSEAPLPDALNGQQTSEGYVAAISKDLAPISLGVVAESSEKTASAKGSALENALVKVTLDEHGRIGSMIDKNTGRELMDGPGNRMMLYRNDLPRNFDAWDIEPGFELGEEELLDLQSMSVTANGPHLAEIEIVRKFSKSTIRQRLRLWSNSPRLEIKTDIDWHERRTYIRASFPVNVLADDAIFDQAIGITKRATHNNTTWQRAQFEVSGHRFAALSETDWGAALLSADKYGFSAKGNVLTLSLVRGPMFPDLLADEGHHSFTYAIMATDGRWWSEALQAEADLLCDPLRAVPIALDETEDIAPIKVGGQQIGLHALKPAMDGDGYVLRISEAAGRRGTFALDLPGGATGDAVNALEEPCETSGDIERPFGLASFKFQA